MRRRRYLAATGTALASVLAGCNIDVGDGDTPTRTDTDTASPTATEPPTETATETPREEPPRVSSPHYMELLPEPHLDGARVTPNANFVKIDWDWYLSHYDTEMRFGSTDSEDWNLEANDGNLYEKQPPDYRMIHTPVGAVIQTGRVLSNIIPEYPNLGPELVQQCGFEMINESGQDESRARWSSTDSPTVDIILAYASPGVTFYTGVDFDGIKGALADNEQRRVDGTEHTIAYVGEGRADGRAMLLSDDWARTVLMVETANEKDEDIYTVEKRLLDRSSPEAADVLESLQWCFSRLATDVPVVIGQVNGGRRKFSGTNWSTTPIRHFSERTSDTVMHGFTMDNGLTATCQVVISNTERPVAKEATVHRAYGPDDGTVSFDRTRHVAELTASWTA